MSSTAPVKVFLDIGAHIGETLSVIIHPRWGFYRIVCFEPAPSYWADLKALADERVEICQFGLWREATTLVLNNAGRVGASIAADKNDVATKTECEFQDVAAWFEANIDEADEVYVKINVEGAEADVVQRLATTGQIGKIDHLLIHFDVRKSPSLSDREPLMPAQLTESGVEFQLSEEIQFGGLLRGTRNWLRWCGVSGPFRDIRYKRLKRIEHQLRTWLYPIKVMLLARSRGPG